jgi:hypothetical protein
MRSFYNLGCRAFDWAISQWSFAYGRNGQVAIVFIIDLVWKSELRAYARNCKCTLFSELSSAEARSFRLFIVIFVTDKIHMLQVVLIRPRHGYLTDLSARRDAVDPDLSVSQVLLTTLLVAAASHGMNATREETGV